MAELTFESIPWRVTRLEETSDDHAVAIASFREKDATFTEQIGGLKDSNLALKGTLDKVLWALISHVEGGLYQGGCRNAVALPEGFDFVLSLYQRERYALPPNCDRREVLMYDSLEQGFEQVEELAADVADRLARGQTVLVHCQAGLNRSGLLSARTLMHRGHTAQDAINLLRDKRSPLVLCNEAFENWLVSL